MAISLQRLTIYLYSAHRAVIFALAQLSCLFRVFKRPQTSLPHQCLRLQLWMILLRFRVCFDTILGRDRQTDRQTQFNSKYHAYV